MCKVTTLEVFHYNRTVTTEQKQGHFPELPGVLFPEIPRVLPEIQHEATGQPPERVAECE